MYLLTQHETITNTAGYSKERLGYGLDTQEMVARFPAVARNVSVPQSIHLQNSIDSYFSIVYGYTEL
jgi:hypothetical protein